MKHDRSYRRAQRERLKRNRRNYWGFAFGELKDAQLAKVIDTPHPCSSYCCGNPRKWFGEVTMQERRFFCEVDD